MFAVSFLFEQSNFEALFQSFVLPSLGKSGYLKQNKWEKIILKLLLKLSLGGRFVC